jgi:hypothetical protein
MTCIICYEIEQALQSARYPMDDTSTPGLSISAKRNRNHQNAERVSVLEGKLARHKKICKGAQAADKVIR